LSQIQNFLERIIRKVVYSVRGYWLNILHLLYRLFSDGVANLLERFFLGPFGIVVAAILRLSDDVALLRQSIAQAQQKAAEPKSQRVSVPDHPDIVLKRPESQPDTPLPYSVFCISCGKEFRIPSGRAQSRKQRHSFHRNSEDP